jgi:CubicO group peptidase (beta-lactamase class C family)
MAVTVGINSMKMERNRTVVLGILLTCAAAAGGADTVQDRIGRVENGLVPTTIIDGRYAGPFSVKERMLFYKTPGLTVAVIDNGAIAWTRSYGSLEAGGSEPVAADTRFPAASISKPVAALVALRLIDQGKLKLDEDVNVRLVSWKIPDIEFTKEKKVTLRWLLSHRAGLTDNAGFVAAPPSQAMPTLKEVLETGKWTPSPIRVGFEPGSRFQYSGGGYCLMEQLLEDVAGKPFPVLARELVLEPCGMDHSSFEQRSAPERAAVAVGHLANGRPQPQRWNVYPATSAAGLWTTPADLARFVIELQQAKAGRSNKLISAATAAEILNVQGATDERDSQRMVQVESFPYDWRLARGLGIGLIGWPPIRFYHTGTNPGYQSELHGYIDGGKGAVIMTNADQGWRLAREIINAIAKEYEWPEYNYPQERKTLAVFSPEQRADLTGTYEVASQGKKKHFVTINEKDGRLFLAIADYLDSVELYPESETKCFTLEFPMVLTFRKDTKGVISELQSDQGWRASRSRQ